MSKSIYDNGMYDELWALSHELTPWFDIDKVKPYSVYVWTKDTDRPDFVHGENVFDIFHDRLTYNAVALACCTALAIALDSWWLIFLIAFFYIPDR